MRKALSLIILLSLIAISASPIAKAHPVSLGSVTVGVFQHQVQECVLVFVIVKNLDLSQGYNYNFYVTFGGFIIAEEHGFVSAGSSSCNMIVYPLSSDMVGNKTADVYLKVADEIAVVDHFVTNVTVHANTLLESVDQLEDDTLELQQNMSDFRFDMANTLNEIDSLRSSINDLQLMNKILLAVSIITLTIAVVAVSVPILTHIRKRDRELIRLEEP